ncbi:hypothetical protein [Lentibacillus sp. Marseille-P4043]|uniref:hypothetical protein n=1 Tax=Lentibacillus sp. Marseille-P4043 TaxID=2040293 RepID=UPI000D0B5022|nr:hypothetical protein [Lentibacillus sp. Marseille-P4043]
MNRSINEIDKDLLALLHKKACKERVASVSQIITEASVYGYDGFVVKDALQVLVDNDMISPFLQTLSYGTKTQDFVVNQKFEYLFSQETVLKISRL